jgi:hypothetical protein
LKTELARQFKIKDLDSLWYFLGIKVAFSHGDYFHFQTKYAIDILKRARLTDNKIVDTLIEVNARYSSFDGLHLTGPALYCTIVGSLVYITITCPDIAYVVHVISLFVASPTTVYWTAVLRILRYLWGTIFQSLLLSSTSFLELRAYSDVDHSSDPTRNVFIIIV